MVEAGHVSLDEGMVRLDHGHGVGRHGVEPGQDVLLGDVPQRFVHRLRELGCGHDVVQAIAAWPRPLQRRAGLDGRGDPRHNGLPRVERGQDGGRDRAQVQLGGWDRSRTLQRRLHDAGQAGRGAPERRRVAGIRRSGDVSVRGRLRLARRHDPEVGARRHRVERIRRQAPGADADRHGPGR